MSDKIKSTIHAKDIDISVLTSVENEDYISLTDIARYAHSDDPTAIISNWLRNKDTISFLGLWEKLHNLNFKPLEFEGFKKEAGSNAFVLSPQKWIKETNAVGIISKSGRYGGTFAHKDIAFEFASWVSPEFKLYVIQDYQRLKSTESHQKALDWNVKRLLSKANYKIHTDAVKQNRIPPNITKKQEGYIYANEADLLNIALFGKTAAQWRQENPDAKGNIRDSATIEQLLVLTNLENLNAEMINRGISAYERLISLNEIAIKQLTILSNNSSVKKLKSMQEDEKNLPKNSGNNSDV